VLSGTIINIERDRELTRLYIREYYTNDAQVYSNDHVIDCTKKSYLLLTPDESNYSADVVCECSIVAYRTVKNFIAEKLILNNIVFINTPNKTK